MSKINYDFITFGSKLKNSIHEGGDSESTGILAGLVINFNMDYDWKNNRV